MNVFRRRRCGFVSDLGRFNLLGDSDFVGARRWLGLLFGSDWRGAWSLGSENAGVERALSRWKRNRRDHSGLNSAGVRGVFAPVGGFVVKEESPTDDEGRNHTVQHKRAGEIDAESFAVAVVVRFELEVCGYGTLLTVSTVG